MTTVFDPVVEHLAECLDSVDEQTEHDWEHVVVDDGSRDPEVADLLDARAGGQRTLARRASNGGIVAAGNDAIGAATGEWVVFLDHDDVLEPTALRAIAEALDVAAPNDDPRTVDVVYTDHAVIDASGELVAVVHKPEFSHHRLRSHNWITHLVAVRRSALTTVGGLRPGLDGAQDHDLLLRLASSGHRFLRVPSVELLWRQSPDSVATDVANKGYAFAAASKAIRDDLDRCGCRADPVSTDHAGVFRIRRQAPRPASVSVVTVAATATDRRWGRRRLPVHAAIGSVLADASTESLVEVVAVVGRDLPDATASGLATLSGDLLRVLDTGAVDAAMWNEGIQAARGDIVVLVDEHASVVAPGSVDALVALTENDDVTLAGGRILAADGRISNAGYLLNPGVVSMFEGWAGDHPGPNRMLVTERECCAVSTVVAAADRTALLAAGGLVGPVSAEADVDLGLRMGGAAGRVVWSPDATFHDFGSGTRSAAAGVQAPVDGRFIDPWTNPNLLPGRGDWLEA